MIDDALGLVVLAVMSGAVTAAAAGGSGLSAFAVVGILVCAVVFLGVTVGIGHLFSGPIVRLAARTGQHGILLVFGLALCFVLAFAVEVVGLADIIGASRRASGWIPTVRGSASGPRKPPSPS